MRFDGHTASLRTLLKKFDSGWRPIDSGYVPALLGKPDGIAAGATSEIESLSRRKLCGGPSQERIGGKLQMLFGKFTATIALVPLVNVHESDGLKPGNVSDASKRSQTPIVKTISKSAGNELVHSAVQTFIEGASQHRLKLLAKILGVPGGFVVLK